MDLVERRFLEKAIIRGGIPLYCANDALEVIAMCENYGWRILGIDSFIVNEVTQPLMDHTLDCRSDNSGEGHWQAANTFIKERANNGYLFEVVYEAR